MSSEVSILPIPLFHPSLFSDNHVDEGSHITNETFEDCFVPTPGPSSSAIKVEVPKEVKVEEGSAANNQANFMKLLKSNVTWEQYHDWQMEQERNKKAKITSLKSPERPQK